MFRHLSIFVTAVVLSVTCLFALLGRHEAPPAAPVAASAEVMAQPVAAQGVVSVAAVPLAASLGFDTLDIVVGRNDTLDGIFRRAKLSLTDLASIRELPGIRQALDLLKPGDQIKLTHQNGDLQGLVRQLNETQTLAVTRAENGFDAQIIENPIEVQIAHKQAVITSSLFEAAAVAGVSDQTALEVANIFGWDVDFVLDIREGDRFRVIYEQVFQDGKYLRDGAVLAAEFVNDGNTYRAVRYQLPDGHSEYFAPDGRSMHKAFLRAPVEFSRISSRFNPRRKHPVLNTIRAHKGVDYAAPTGTPVRAAGDGRVQFRGQQGGYGNVLVLEHGGGVTTLYGHLSRFAKGAQRGGRVHQGQIIAYVGMTGLATGPHLHYEYRVNGVHRNPQTVKLADARPIAPELLNDFTTRTRPLIAALDSFERGALVASQ